MVDESANGRIARLYQALCLEANYHFSASQNN